MDFKYNKQGLAKLAKQFDLRFVIGHGSRTTGQPLHPESDLDIAVVGKQVVDFDTLLKLYGRFDDIFGGPHELDLKSLDQADPLFRHEVVRSGILLHGDSTDYEDYKAAVYRAYNDARPLFELERILSERYQRHLNKTYAQPTIHPAKN